MPSFRLATSADLTTLTGIEDAAGFNHWSVVQLEESLHNHIVFVAEEKNGLTGFAVFNNVIDEVELLNIVVLPAEQGKGIGRALLQYVLTLYCEQSFKRCFLEVAITNTHALALYRCCGFEQIGLRKNYYASPDGKEDAIIMQLDLRRNICKN